VWAEQYTDVEGTLQWREVKDMPSPAELLVSPSELEARYSTKREVGSCTSSLRLIPTV